MANLVLTLIGPDRPGIVDAVSDTVASHGGNWLESRMAQLAGKFAGVLLVEVADDRVGDLETALRGLGSDGLQVIVERSEPQAPVPLRPLEIELVGQDRPGLVHEIASVLASLRVNVEDLATDRPAAAHSGSAIFRARIRASVPAGVDVREVRGRLERLAADLMADVRLIEALRPPE